jgi:hypothetical protein
MVMVVTMMVEQRHNVFDASPVVERTSMVI